MRFYVVAGIFAVLGHNYTCWLKFKGGKGIATTAGVYLALAPLAVGYRAGGFRFGAAADAICFRRFHFGGGGVASGGLDFVSRTIYFLGIVTTALGALAIYKHKSNIQRLMAGTENRLGKKVVGQASSLPGRQDACPTKDSEANK